MGGWVGGFNGETLHQCMNVSVNSQRQKIKFHLVKTRLEAGDYLFMLFCKPVNSVGYPELK